MTQKAIGPTFYDELVAHGGLVGEHFTWSADGALEFFDDTPADVRTGVEAVYAAHNPDSPSRDVFPADRDARLAKAARRIAPLQDAVDLGEATADEQASLLDWKRYRVALNRLDLTAAAIEWPVVPTA